MKDIDINITVDDVQDPVEDTSRKSFFYRKMPLIGRVSYLVFFLTLVLVPVLFLSPTFGLQTEYAKKFLLSGGVLLSFALWLVTRLEDGIFVFPGGGIFWTGLFVVVSFFVSSILSSSTSLSFFGLGYENDTFLSIVVLFIAMFLASAFFESKKKSRFYFMSFIFSAIAIGAIQLIQVFSPIKLLSGGVLSNLIGKWNDLGIFFGLSALLAVVGLELSSFDNRMFSWLFRVLLVVSLIIITLVNYDIIWAVVGVFSLVIFLYSMIKRGAWSGDEGSDFVRKLGVIFKPSFIVLVIAVALYSSTNAVGGVLGNYGIYQLEVRPSWQSTVDVASATLQKNSVFGSGPNTFSVEWASRKPDAVNSTVFWNTDFNVGFGRIPSYAVTLGIFGIITFGLFLLMLVYYGLKSLLASFDDPSHYFLVLVSCVATLYLWSFQTFYVTDTVMLALAFVFTGIFLASMVRAGLVRNYRFTFFGNKRLGFITVLALVLLIITSVSGGYLTYRKFVALYDFQQGLYSFNMSGDLDKAETLFKSAVSLDEQDLYYRTIADLYTIRLRNVLSTGANAPKENLLVQLQVSLSAAVASAKKATELNPNNYLNWITLGNVGVEVVPLKDVVGGSYDMALASYNKALSLNPKNPSIYLALARLEVARGDLQKAEGYINQAVNMKGNYTAALFLMSQIEASRGNLVSAITKAEQAAVFSPQDVGVLFQIGLLKYMRKDYSGAVTALKSATDIQTNYSNAKYFLGLSYSKLGQVANAIKEFKDISALNPDSVEVQNILKNLKAGRSALDNVAPPGNEPKEPEKRSGLPIQEKAVNGN